MRGTVTRDVDPAAIGDLLARPPRGSVTFVEGDGVGVAPARVRVAGDGCRFGVAPGTTPDLDGREVVVLVDDGPYWFELRGASCRGVATRSEKPVAEPDGLVWHAVAPRRVLAWDYATIREA